MAKVFLKSLFDGNAGEWELGPYSAFVNSARHSSHILTDDPAAADIILFTDAGRDQYTVPVRSAVYQQFWQKCFIFFDGDCPVPLLPGIYASIPKRWYDQDWCKSGFYVHSRHQAFDKLPFQPEPKLLFSFAGSCQNAAIRQKLTEINYPRFKLIDTQRETSRANQRGDSETLRRLREQYIRLGKDSKFLLCPRGVGVSSVRLFEAMAMGRCPVILSDDWVAPEGIPWSEFSIRVREKNYRRLPAILEEKEIEAEKLGQKAREIWQQSFSPTKVFDTAVDACVDLLNKGATRRRHVHLLKRLNYLRWPHLKSFLRGKAFFNA